MFKKLFINLTPLLAIAALAVMPVAAQAATQHWYKSGGIMPAGEATPFVWWGSEVNLNQILLPPEPEFVEVNCKVVGGGEIENPLSGGAGVGGMNALAFYECKGASCEAEIMKLFAMQGRESVEAVNMPAAINGHPERRFVPYFMQLEESAVAGVTSVRLKIGEPFGKFEKTSPPGMIRVRVLCEIAATEMATGTPIYEGELKPEIGVAKIGNLNGTNASKPSQFRFAGASTGALHSEFPKFPPGGEDQFTEVAKYLGYNEQELITVKP